MGNRPDPQRATLLARITRVKPFDALPGDGSLRHGLRQRRQLARRVRLVGVRGRAEVYDWHRLIPRTESRPRVATKKRGTFRESSTAIGSAPGTSHGRGDLFRENEHYTCMRKE